MSTDMIESVNDSAVNAKTDNIDHFSNYIGDIAYSKMLGKIDGTLLAEIITIPNLKLEWNVEKYNHNYVTFYGNEDSCSKYSFTTFPAKSVQNELTEIVLKINSNVEDLDLDLEESKSICEQNYPKLQNLLVDYQTESILSDTSFQFVVICPATSELFKCLHVN